MGEVCYIGSALLIAPSIEAKYDYYLPSKNQGMLIECHPMEGRRFSVAGSKVRVQEFGFRE